jgi:hypothetical protein
MPWVKRIKLNDFSSSPSPFFLFLISLVVLIAIFHWVKLGNIEDILDSSNRTIVFFQGFSSKDGHYFLEGGQIGKLIIKFTSTTRFREGYCYLDFYSDSLVKNEISISARGDKWQIISQNLSYQNNKLALTKYINGWDQFYLRFIARNQSKTKLEILSLNNFYLSSRSRAYQIRNLLYLIICLPCLFGIFHLKKISLIWIWLLIILSGFGMLSLAWKKPVVIDFSPDILLLLLTIYLFFILKKNLSPPLLFYALLLISASIFFATVETWFFQLPLFILSGFLLGILWPILQYVQVRRKNHIILFFALGYGILLRGIYLWIILKTGAGIGSDESGYDELARSFQFSHFYAASYREPLFVASLKAYFWFLQRLNVFDLLESNNFLPIRSFSFIFSILLILLTYKIARNLWNEKTGLIAASLMSASSILITNATRGTIMEFFSFLNLCFFYLVFIEKGIGINKRLVLLGITGGALLLTRSSTPYIILLILIYGMITDKRYQTWKIAITILLAVILASPFYINNKKRWGEFNFIANYHATWWKNYEFTDWVGHQRAEVLEKDGYAGERVTPYTYFFKYHSFSEVLKRIILGYHMAFSKWIYKYETLVMPLMAGGLILIFLSPYRAVGIMWIVLILPYAFVLSLRGGPERFIYESFPFIALSAAYIIDKTSRSFLKKVSRQETIVRIVTTKVNQKPCLNVLLSTLLATSLVIYNGCVYSKEIYDEHGIRSWRCYLANTYDTIQKIFLIPPDSHQYREVYLKIFMHGALKTNPKEKNTYMLVIKVNERIAQVMKEGVSSEMGWKYVAIDPNLIKGKDKIMVSFFLTGKPDPTNNYVNFYGEETTVTTKTHRSLFNGSSKDLSPESGLQQGEYLIRLVLRRKEK